MPWSLEGVLPCRRQLALEEDLNALARLDQAPRLAERIVGFLGDLVARDPGGRLATRLISAFNDRLTTRVIELTARRHRLPAVSWCWLALGSEGRHEQTFVSDQDNGLVFSATGPDEAAALRELFVPFAQEVNRRLADCGFPLCQGEVMAGNPAWCLSLEEWRDRFIDWVRRPDPQALLNASIFFDLAPLYGDADLAERLRSAVLSLTVDAPSFLHLMAANALNAPAPLNFRGEPVADGGEFGDEIDLKKFGTRIFVDAARIFALAAGARAVNTSARLHDAGLAAGLQAADIAAVEAAFAELLRLRLAHQLVPGNPAGREGTGIPLGTLNDFDRAILRESLKQARRLQQRLKLNYAL
jgi:CBS domain-containing protein